MALDRRGVADCAFCRTRAARLSSVVPTTQDLRRELEGRRRLPKWVWLGPWSDAFVPGAQALAPLALRCADILLQRDVGVTLRTRGDFDSARGLQTLARRHGSRLRVEVAVFSSSPALCARWERGAGSLEGRLTLIQALRDSGADVSARLGPLIPFVNDAHKDLNTIVKRLADAGADRIQPVWIEDGSGLMAQVAQEVSRSQARTLDGWFRMQGAWSRGERRFLARKVRWSRQDILTSLGTQHGVRVHGCMCADTDTHRSCVAAPSGLDQRPQLDLFAGSA